MSWVVWEEQTCDQIDRLYRAIGSRVMMTFRGFFAMGNCVTYYFTDPDLCYQIPLRTIWMGRTLKLLDFVGKCHISLSGKSVTIRFFESSVYLQCMHTF